MGRIDLNITFHTYPGGEGLESSDLALIALAQEAARKAYAPYSGFRVGAAVQLENGETIPGNNQENVAYPSGLCAERVALFNASARYPGVAVKTLAIAAETGRFTLQTPVYPCGACRQVMSEYETIQGRPIRVLMTGPGYDTVEASSVNDLLPLRFAADQLRNETK
ncbi:MAG TPA: cytidine deaminase [Bacteroidales bacterium]|nr:cytidine deaminase [Bacteroidales bacterium]HRZ76635.1 cytidine deaminase [Bacteroidales bacterium]